PAYANGGPGSVGPPKHDRPVSARLRIGVIAPRPRLLRWHEKVIAVLRQAFDVDVYATEVAPPYPTALRLWMRVERWLLGERDLVSFVTIPASAWPPREHTSYAFILNLTEAPIALDTTPVVEPRFDGRADSLALV